MNPLDLFFVEAHRDELGQPAAFADDPERAVLGIDERDRGLDDLPQDGLEVEVAADRDDRFEQRMHPIARLDRGRKPDLQLGQQVIKAQLGQQWRALTRLHPASKGFAVNKLPELTPAPVSIQRAQGAGQGNLG